MAEVLVSFCVTAYNTEKYIAECLDSIIGQQGDYSFEIIVVDDASTDGTQKVVEKYSDSRIRYIRHTQNQGAFVTVNRGFEEARGQFVARIDSDDRYNPTFLQRTVPILEKYPEVGLVYGDIAMINSSGEITSNGGNVNRKSQPVKGNELVSLLRENYIPAPTILARREAWAVALPVPQGYSFCDWYLSLGISQHWEFFYIDQVLADYRIHTQNMHRNMIRDKTGERITFQVLNDIFQDSHAKKPSANADFQKLKPAVYGNHYVTLANKYFGAHMSIDARRCYLKAIQYQPHLALDLSILRRLSATVIGMQTYERSKAIVKSLLHPKLKHL